MGKAGLEPARLSAHDPKEHQRRKPKNRYMWRFSVSSTRIYGGCLCHPPPQKMAGYVPLKPFFAVDFLRLGINHP